MNWPTCTSTNVYAVDTDDIEAVMQAVSIAVRDVITHCPHGHTLAVARDIVEDSSVTSNLLYRVLGVRHRNLQSGLEVHIESHVVMSYKITEHCAVAWWDFVDDDQLHPVPDTTNIVREITGACLVRREVCADGQTRTVVRALATKCYRYRSCHDPSERYYVTEESMFKNAVLFQSIVLDHLSAETEGYRRIRRRPFVTSSVSGDGACPCPLR